jgi:hypothetical protein
MKTPSKNITGQSHSGRLARPEEPVGYLDKSSKARHAHKSRVKIKELKTGIFIDATMRHYSKNDIYIETDSLLLPGTEIYIGIENSPYISLPNVYDIYRGEVKWLRMLNSSAYKYGCCIKLNLTTPNSNYFFKGCGNSNPRLPSIRLLSRIAYEYRAAETGS